MVFAIFAASCQPQESGQPSEDSGGTDSQTEDASRETALNADPDRPLPGEHNDWRISLTGWGKLKIGMTLADVRKTLPFTIDSMSDLDPGQECFVLIPSDAPESYAFMFVGAGEKAKLARIYVDASGPETISGISVGTSEAAVRKAYGAKIQEEPHKYVEGWKQLIFVPEDASDKHLRLVFTTDGNLVQQISVGRLPEILNDEACN